MKVTEFLTSKAYPLAKVKATIDKAVRLEPGQTIFLYLKSTFAPSLDTLLRDLFDNFGMKDGKNDTLVIKYAIQDAWG